MTVCPHCNYPVEPNVVFCSGCGKHISGKVRTVEQTARPMPTGHNYPPVQPMYGYPDPPMGEPYQPPLPMGWYKFLINFALFATGVVHILNAVLAYTGICFVPMATYESAQDFMNYHPMLKVAAVVLSIAYLGAAVFAFYTRSQLAAYKRNAPALLKYHYLISLGLTLLTFVSVVIEDFWMSAQVGRSLAQSVIVTIIMISANNTYFKKRAHLFNK